MWPLCSQCDKGAPCPGWGTGSTSTVRLAVMGGHVPRGRCQMLQPPWRLAEVPSVTAQHTQSLAWGEDQPSPWDRGLLLGRSGGLYGQGSPPAVTPGLGWGWHSSAGRCHPVSLHRSPPPSPPVGRRGQHLGGHRTALPASPHRLGALPLPAPPAPRACALPALSGRALGRGVSAGALGPAEGQVCPAAAQRCWGPRVPPPAATSLLVAVTVSVQRGNLGTETDPAAPHPSPALV